MKKTTVFLLILMLCFAVNATQPSLFDLKKAEQNVVLLQNPHQLVPLQGLDTLKVTAVSVGQSADNDFSEMLAKYMAIKSVALSEKNVDSTRNCLSVSNLKIVAVFKSALSENELAFLIRLQKQSGVVVCSFANPSQWLGMVGKSTTFVLAPNAEVASQQMAAQLIFGGIAAQGKLTAKLGSFKKGTGLTTQAIRFKYTLPEDAGIDGKKLAAKIDSLVNDAIAQQTFPGCVVLVAKDRKIVFTKAYGYHTYLKVEGDNYKNDVLNRKTEVDDLFDLASVTKVTAGCPAYLKLVDEGKINLDEKFSTYFPVLKGSNKENITVKEFLCHVGGLQAYSPFYKWAVNADGSLNPNYVRSVPSEEFPIRISAALYARKDIGDSIYKAIAKSPLLSSYPKHKYVYSDWPFVMTPPVVEAIEHKPFEEFLQSTFYRSLGASEMMYNPWRTIPLSRIVPTELDNFFRQTQLLGYVHDEASGIMGGHSANAGLFSNANDLAKLLQLYLQKGTYGGKRYFSEKTFDTFNSCPFEKEGVRRGICFDKPDMKDGKVVGHSYCSSLASPEAFGHSGYTGTAIWVDPTCNLVYIFLSNRVYPTRNNSKIVTTKIRAKVQTAIYESFINSKNK
ncbi:MAG: glycoside hydrolase [Bacteroidetes bacterium]|nr:glycoside hydrolase [Bacteroidota bacterium]